MATSNSTDWSLNRDQLITTALRKIGVVPSGGTPTTNQINDCVDTLQAIVKAFMADGMAVWKVATQTFTVVSGTNSYTVGPSQTINCPKPLRVIQGFWTPSGGNNTPLNIYTRYDYNVLATTATGDPVDLYYQPLRTTGVIRLWPTPNNSTTVISFDYISPYEDMDASSNDFDFPPEWIMALIYTLAWAMAPEYGLPILDRQELKKDADFWHQYALSMGSEEGSLNFKPNMDE